MQNNLTIRLKIAEKKKNSIHFSGVGVRTHNAGPTHCTKLKVQVEFIHEFVDEMLPFQY